jgi:hypothetical protein
MHLRTDVMRDEAHDAFAIGSCEPLTRVDQPFCQAIDPQSTVGVEHDFDDARIFKPCGDGRPECGAQHARAARDRFRPECKCPDHPPPPQQPRSPTSRMIKRANRGSVQQRTTGRSALA